MDGHRDIGADQVEWLDLGPPEHPPGRPRPRQPRRSWWVLAGAAGAAAIVVVSLNTPANRPAATRNHPLTSTSSSSESAPTPTTSQPAAVGVIDTGHRFADVPAGWELFGRGPGVVVRIELARGRITSTTVPPLATGGGVGFLPGPHQVIIRPYDNVPGYLVPDGRPSRGLPAALASAGVVLPGPDPDHVWQQHESDRSVTLVGFDGRPTTVSLAIPDSASVIPDGAGYIAFYATGGVYDVRRDGIRRITAGELLATGPTRWLARECDEQYRCSLVVIDQRSGARRTLDVPPGLYNNGGLISPDGSTAALVGTSASGVLTVHLVDLSTGADLVTGAFLAADFGFDGGTLVWTPDSRSLFVLVAPRRVLVLDRRTLRVSALGVTLPPIGQLAFRSSPG